MNSQANVLVADVKRGSRRGRGRGRGYGYTMRMSDTDSVNRQRKIGRGQMLIMVANQRPNLTAWHVSEEITADRVFKMDSIVETILNYIDNIYEKIDFVKAVIECNYRQKRYIQNILMSTRRNDSLFF